MRIRLDYGSWHGHPLRDITYFLGRLLRMFGIKSKLVDQLFDVFIEIA